MVLDDWIYFDCFARTAVLLKFLRKQLVTCENIMVTDDILLIFFLIAEYLAGGKNETTRFRSRSL